MQGYALDGVIGVVVVEVGLDVLRVVDVTVITFAVVLPDQLPIGVHVEVHDLGDLGASHSLGAGNRADRGSSRLKVRRLRRQADENHAFNFAGVSTVHSQFRFVQSVLHTAPEQ